MHVSDRLLTRITSWYFESSYALLGASPEGRAFLDGTSAIPGVPTHGYATTGDLEVLIDALRAGPHGHLLDLGCGLGGIAIALHQRTGTRVTGLDVSARAVVTATSATTKAGVDGSVAFVLGSIREPPRVGADGAYALDSLMFVRIDGALLRGIGAALDPPARLFATTLAFGRVPRDPVVAAVRRVGGTVISSEDVTDGLLHQSRRRRRCARNASRRGPRAIRGQLGMLLVVIEESLVQAAVRHGRLRRWRTVLDLGSDQDGVTQAARPSP